MPHGICWYSCDVMPGTSSDVVVREEEGEREGGIVVVRDEGETATGRLVGAEN